MQKPNFFIVGAPKCGTTSMYEYLQQHPNIFMSYIKELHYFGTDMHGKKHWNKKGKSDDDYLAYFEGWNGEEHIGEASVYYLFSERAAQEIHDFNPDARIIAMLRNPVDMLYSMYHQKRFSGGETLPTFEEALAAEPKRKAEGAPRRLYYREIATYTPQVKRYFDVFGRDQVRVIIFDDLKADVEAVYRDTLRFLGADDTFEADLRVHNPNTVVRSKRIRNFLKNPPSWYISLLKVGKRTLPVGVRDRGRRLIKSANSMKATRQPMKPETREELKEYYRLEVQRLSELLGRDLTHWCE